MTCVLKMASGVRWMLLLLFLSLSAAAQAQDLRVFTEQLAPYNYLEDGEPKGLAVEIVQALLKDSKVNAKIEFLPWNRAYATALKEPNVMLFVMSRSDEREALFDWVLRVVPTQPMSLFRLASRTDIHIASLEDAKAYMIGTAATTDITTQRLIKEGFVVGKNLDSVQGGDAHSQNFQKLMLGRIDLLADSAFTAVYAAKGLGIDRDKFTAAFTNEAVGKGLWITLSLGSDPSLVQQLNVSARKLEKQGVLKAILEKYSH